MANEKTLQLPEGMAYTCHSEGVCCRAFDTIPVDAAAAQALEHLDVAQLNAAAGNAPAAEILAPNPTGATATKIARRACGDCTMLTGDNLCAIHKLAGEAAKPRVCQDFPWRFVETPGGIYVGLSFVCPSVRNSRGEAVAAQGEKLESLYTRAASVREATGSIALNNRQSLSWGDYLKLDEALQELIRLPGEPLATRLIACCILPGFVGQATAQGGAEPGAILDALRQAAYQHVLHIARKPSAGNSRNRRMFLGMFVSFANTLQWRKKGRLLTVSAVMAQYFRHAVGFGQVRLEPMGVSLSHEELNGLGLPDDPAASDLLARYVEHCIWRKDLLLGGDVNRRMRLLALNAALVPWYAAALGKAAGRPRPTYADWDEAVGHVERLYGFHSAFYRFFEQNRTFSDIVDSYILKPGFPFLLFSEG